MVKLSYSLNDILRRIRTSTVLLNLAGAFVVFLYISVVDPLPEGSQPVQAIPPVELFLFLTVIVLTFASGMIWRMRSDRRLARWYAILMQSGKREQVPPGVQREVLNVPLMTTVRTIIMWLLAGLCFSLYNDSLRIFFGIVAVGGLLTSVLTYLLVEELWRPIIPVFFPDGDLSAVGAFRLPVLGRLLIVILLVGLLPPIILVNLTWQRAQALLAATNPQAILENLFILQVFILAAGALVGIGLAVFVTRSITNPLKTMQNAMARVEENEFDTRVPVTGNDELGYLSERFNQMAEGLKQGELLRKLFGLYVSPEVARSAVETGAGLGGELVTSTILFSDLRDFTRLSEGMPPDRLIRLINRYMTVMVSAIKQRGGIVTRFGGDSILAVFGTPLNPSGHHAAQAVQAAFDMRQALQDFNRAQAEAGEPLLRMGIGIATGQVVAGNVGGSERIEYTVMGDATNLASRLQDKTKELDGDILISAATYQEASRDISFQARMLSGVSIKGKQQNVTVYVM